MNEEYKDDLKQCCLYRWNTMIGSLLVSTIRGRENFALQVVGRELGARPTSSELNNLTLEEDKKLIRELVSHLLANR